MNDSDIKIINERYNERLKKYGDDIKALASGNLDRRKIRFDVLSEVGNLQGKSILDLGCGFADFYEYLNENNVNVDYTGYDINDKLIQVCKEKYPDATFEVKNFLKDNVDNKYDYIISSQVFNNKLKFEDNLTVVKDVIKKAYDIAQEGVAIDMLTSYVDFEEEHLSYYSPEKMFSYSKEITKRVVLRHDYPLYEFALFLYKDFKGWSK